MDKEIAKIIRETHGKILSVSLTEKELQAIFDVVNVYEPQDISHVYPAMATNEFMNDVNSAWKKILNTLDIARQN